MIGSSGPQACSVFIKNRVNPATQAIRDSNPSNRDTTYRVSTSVVALVATLPHLLFNSIVGGNSAMERRYL